MEYKQAVLLLTKLHCLHETHESDSDEIYMRVYSDGKLHGKYPTNNNVWKMHTGDVDSVDIEINCTYLDEVSIEIWERDKKTDDGHTSDKDEFIGWIYIRRGDNLDDNNCGSRTINQSNGGPGKYKLDFRVISDPIATVRVLGIRCEQKSAGMNTALVEAVADVASDCTKKAGKVIKKSPRPSRKVIGDAFIAASKVLKGLEEFADFVGTILEGGDDDVYVKHVVGTQSRAQDGAFFPEGDDSVYPMRNDDEAHFEEMYGHYFRFPLDLEQVTIEFRENDRRKTNVLIGSVVIDPEQIKKNTNEGIGSGSAESYEGCPPIEGGLAMMDGPAVVEVANAYYGKRNGEGAIYHICYSVGMEDWCLPASAEGQCDTADDVLPPNVHGYFNEPRGPVSFANASADCDEQGGVLPTVEEMSSLIRYGYTEGWPEGKYWLADCYYMDITDGTFDRSKDGSEARLYSCKQSGGEDGVATWDGNFGFTFKSPQGLMNQAEAVAAGAERNLTLPSAAMLKQLVDDQKIPDSWPDGLYWGSDQSYVNIPEGDLVESVDGTEPGFYTCYDPDAGIDEDNVRRWYGLHGYYTFPSTQADYSTSASQAGEQHGCLPTLSELRLLIHQGCIPDTWPEGRYWTADQQWVNIKDEYDVGTSTNGSESYFYCILVNPLHCDDVDPVHDGVDQIHEGIDQIHENADQTDDGLEQIHGGIEQIRDGVDKVHKGIELGEPISNGERIHSGPSTLVNFEQAEAACTARGGSLPTLETLRLLVEKGQIPASWPTDVYYYTKEQYMVDISAIHSNNAIVLSEDGAAACYYSCELHPDGLSDATGALAAPKYIVDLQTAVDACTEQGGTLPSLEDMLQLFEQDKIPQSWKILKGVFWAGASTNTPFCVDLNTGEYWYSESGAELAFFSCFKADGPDGIEEWQPEDGYYQYPQGPVSLADAHNECSVQGGELPTLAQMQLIVQQAYFTWFWPNKKEVFENTTYYDLLQEYNKYQASLEDDGEPYTPPNVAIDKPDPAYYWTVEGKVINIDTGDVRDPVAGEQCYYNCRITKGYNGIETGKEIKVGDTLFTYPVQEDKVGTSTEGFFGGELASLEDLRMLMEEGYITEESNWPISAMYRPRTLERSNLATRACQEMWLSGKGCPTPHTTGKRIWHTYKINLKPDSEEKSQLVKGHFSAPTNPTYHNDAVDICRSRSGQLPSLDELRLLIENNQVPKNWPTDYPYFAADLYDTKFLVNIKTGNWTLHGKDDGIALPGFFTIKKSSNDHRMEPWTHWGFYRLPQDPISYTEAEEACLATGGKLPSVAQLKQAIQHGIPSSWPSGNYWADGRFIVRLPQGTFEHVDDIDTCCHFVCRRADLGNGFETGDEVAMFNSLYLSPIGPREPAKTRIECEYGGEMPDSDELRQLIESNLIPASWPTDKRYICVAHKNKHYAGAVNMETGDYNKVPNPFSNDSLYYTRAIRNTQWTPANHWGHIESLQSDGSYQLLTGITSDGGIEKRNQDGSYVSLGRIRAPQSGDLDESLGEMEAVLEELNGDGSYTLVGAMQLTEEADGTTHIRIYNGKTAEWIDGSIASDGVIQTLEDGTNVPVGQVTSSKYHYSAGAAFFLLPVFDKYYRIVAEHSDMALDVQGASLEVQAPIVQAPIDEAADSQLFTMEGTGDGFYRFRNKNSGLVIDIEGSKTGDKAPALQYFTTENYNQMFEFKDEGEGYYRLKARHSGKALKVREPHYDAGAVVAQDDVSDNYNKFWFSEVEDGYYKVSPDNWDSMDELQADGSYQERARITSGGVIGKLNDDGSYSIIGRRRPYNAESDPAGFVDMDSVFERLNDDNSYTTVGGIQGENVYRSDISDWLQVAVKDDGTIQTTDGGTPTTVGRILSAQAAYAAGAAFFLFPIFDRYYHIVAEHSGLVLDVRDHSTAEEAEIVQAPVNMGSDSQRFKRITADSGFYYLMNKNSGKVLGIREGKTGDDTPLWQYTLSEEPHQMFGFDDQGNSLYQIIARHSGKALKVRDPHYQDQQQVAQNDLNDNYNKFGLHQVEAGFFETSNSHWDSIQVLENGGSYRTLAGVTTGGLIQKFEDDGSSSRLGRIREQQQGDLPDGLGNVDAVIEHWTENRYRAVGAIQQGRIYSIQSGDWLDATITNDGLLQTTTGGAVSDVGRVVSTDSAYNAGAAFFLLPLFERYYLITAGHSGYVIDVKDGVTNDEAYIIQNTEAEPANPCQLFALKPTSHGYYALVNKHSQKVIEIQGASNKDDAPALQFPYIGMPHQMFRLDDAGGDLYELVCRRSNLALKVRDPHDQPGNRIAQNDKNDNYNKFSLTLIEDGYFVF